MLDGIRESYPLAKRDGDGLRLVLGVGEGSAQVRVGLRLRCVETVRGRALIVRAFLGARSILDPAAALAINGHLLHGAIAVEGGDLLLHSVLVEGRGSPEAHLEEVAGEAARIKAALRRMPGDHDVFDAYRE